MRLNRDDKTVVIPVKWVKGEFQYFYSGKMPKLREGTIGDLVVPAEAVDDKEFLSQLSRAHDSQDLLPRDTTVYAAVSTQRIPKDLADIAKSGSSLFRGRLSSVTAAQFQDYLFVEIVLEEPLWIQLRGTKSGRLKPAKCRIPSLNMKAQSLNHAYQLISEAFEPQRMSHTGNVFDKILVAHPDGSDGVTLDSLRSTREARHASTLDREPVPEIGTGTPTVETKNSYGRPPLTESEKQSLLAMPSVQRDLETFMAAQRVNAKPWPQKPPPPQAEAGRSASA